MANKEDDPPGKEKNEPTIKVRDLKVKKEIKGGARNGGSGEKRPQPKTGEMDFMNWD